MKFLTVESSPLPILIPLGPKYSPQDPVFKYVSLHSSLNVGDYVSQPYSTTGNFLVLYILIFQFLERFHYTYPFHFDIVINNTFHFILACYATMLEYLTQCSALLQKMIGFTFDLW